MPGFHAFIANAISITNAWYPHAIILLHHTEKYSISNKAINMHSRGPTEQYFYVWEPHCGYLLIKEGQRGHIIVKWSRIPIYYTTN